MPFEPYQLYAITAGLLFGLGLTGIFLCRHFIKKIIAANILGSAAFLLLVCVAKRDSTTFADPVPHAMVITGIVVAVSASAFALALARKIHHQSGQCTFDQNP